MTNQTDDKTLEYQHKTEALYAADNFKKRWYPANPFDDGVWIEASKVPIEVFRICAEAELALTDEGSTWLSTVIEHCPHILIRVDSKWVKALESRKHSIQMYVQLTIQNNLAAAADIRKRIFDSDDLQLKQDLIEANESLNFEPGDMELIVDSNTILIEE